MPLIGFEGENQTRIVDCRNTQGAPCVFVQGDYEARQNDGLYNSMPASK